MRRLDPPPRELIELRARPSIRTPQLGPQIADEAGQLRRLQLLHGDLLKLANEARDGKGLTLGFPRSYIPKVGVCREENEATSAEAIAKRRTVPEGQQGNRKSWRVRCRDERSVCA